MRPRVLREAEDAIREAMLFYEDRQEGLGVDFYDRVSESIRLVGEDPLRFPLYEGKQLSREFRRAPVKRFPYIVIYQRRQGETLIVAVAHTSRAPGYWEER